MPPPPKLCYRTLKLTVNWARQGRLLYFNESALDPLTIALRNSHIDRSTHGSTRNWFGNNEENDNGKESDEQNLKGDGEEASSSEAQLRVAGDRYPRCAGA